MSVRTEPRFTRDVDLVVAVADDAGAESIAAAFGPGLRVVAVAEHDSLQRLATARLAAEAHATPVLDLLFASSGIEAEVAAAAEPLEVFPGVVVPVAVVGHLLALKTPSASADRPQDSADLAALTAVASEADRALARAALALISERGAHRGRDLDAAARDL